jgi:hypothetical protein
VTVGVEQKDRWDDEIEDSEAIDSMADLVRTSVEAYISGSSSSGINQVAGAGDGEVSEDLLDVLEDIHSTTREIQNDVEGMRSENPSYGQIESLLFESVFLHTKEAMRQVLDEDVIDEEIIDEF